MRAWKVNYPCGCQFNGEDFDDEPPEYCPGHGPPKTLFGYPVVENKSLPSDIVVFGTEEDIGRIIDAVTEKILFGDPEASEPLGVINDPEEEP